MLLFQYQTLMLQLCNMFKRNITKRKAKEKICNFQHTTQKLQSSSRNSRKTKRNFQRKKNRNKIHSKMNVCCLVVPAWDDLPKHVIFFFLSVSFGCFFFRFAFATIQKQVYHILEQYKTNKRNLFASSIQCCCCCCYCCCWCCCCCYCNAKLPDHF